MPDYRIKFNGPHLYRCERFDFMTSVVVNFPDSKKWVKKQTLSVSLFMSYVSILLLYHRQKMLIVHTKILCFLVKASVFCKKCRRFVVFSCVFVMQPVRCFCFYSLHADGVVDMMCTECNSFNWTFGMKLKAARLACRICLICICFRSFTSQFSKRRPFAFRKAVFCRVKGHLSERKRRPFAERPAAGQFPVAGGSVGGMWAAVQKGAFVFKYYSYNNRIN